MRLSLAATAAALDIAAPVIRVDYLGLLPMSRLDLPTSDLGFAGAPLATEDNMTTGSFMGDSFTVETVAVPPEEAEAAFAKLMGEWVRLVVVLARAHELLAMADASPEGSRLLNALAPDPALRSEDCAPKFFTWARACRCGPMRSPSSWSEALDPLGADPRLPSGRSRARRRQRGLRHEVRRRDRRDARVRRHRRRPRHRHGLCPGPEPDPAVHPGPARP